MPRVCPPSSIALSICFKVRRIFANSERWPSPLARRSRVSPVRFLGVCAHRLGGHLRRHHPILEPGKYTLLKVHPV
jgi:hypothetical protein